MSTTQITIFSSSNREDNKTKIFAEVCMKVLEGQGVQSKLFNLEQMPSGLTGFEMYNYENSPLAEIVEKYLRPVHKLVFVLPEYNGSFPGILKLFIDSVDPKCFAGKKAALIGVASGRSGNVRGMDHLAAILNYLKTDVYHNKLPISSIHKLVRDGQLNDPPTLSLIEGQMKGFLEF